MRVLSGKNSPFPRAALLVLIGGLTAVVLIALFSFYPLINPPSTLNGFDDAKALADQYVARVGSGLKVIEIEEWTSNFYVRVQEENTGINAFELLVNRYGNQVGPEPGPNMMWNRKYGMMSGIMGNLYGTTSDNMTINATEASEIAQKWLDTNYSGTTVEEPDTFYGYYTMDFSRNGNTVGMLSVNGYSGSVWFHTWHGNFIERMEYSQ